MENSNIIGSTDIINSSNTLGLSEPHKNFIRGSTLLDFSINDLSNINEKKKSDNKSNLSNRSDRKKNIKKTNNFMKNIITKVKEQLINDEIKNEIFSPLYNEIYFKILPHYLTFLILLCIIIVLLLFLIYITINITKTPNNNFY
jgi:uncharacterized integral membrane protein